MSDKILKPFSVEISVTTVVMAADRVHAMQVAQETANEAFSDLSRSDYDYSFGREVRDVHSLPALGWDGDCLPYGGDGKTRLRDILALLEDAPTADTKTIDMFSGQHS